MLGPDRLEDGLRAALEQPPATLLVLPNGWVKVATSERVLVNPTHWRPWQKG